LASRGSESSRPDADALTELSEIYYDRIARYIATRVGNRETAEDMAGDVFVRAVESFGSYQERGLPVQAWLFRIAHNLVIDHYRRNARRQTVPIEDAAELVGTPDPSGEVELKLSMERVNEMIEYLNPGQQEVIALRFVGGLSAEEAGTVMGRTPGAIRELQRTALKALRALLGPTITHLGALGPAGASGTDTEAAES
jgi:RNA polymerase sigma-70 factor (ECF subfamily)